MARTSYTLEDVARAAGVSPSTVSRVINGTARVRPGKLKAVLEAIERLGYQPNLMAKGLAQGKSLTVGVMVQEIASPFYGEMIKGIEQGLDGTLYHPVFSTGHWRAEQEREALRVLSARQIDALIVLDGLVSEEYLLGLARKMPLVLFGRRIRGLEHNTLLVDNLQGAYLGTRHLVELGHTHIVHIAGPAFHLDAKSRLEGYRKALEEAGIPFEPERVIEGDYVEPSGMLAVESLLARRVPFTAIFAANDQMAYGARLALYRRGIRVPEDVSLVGFDDLPGSSYMTPPLTTVRQPTLELGREAARAALLMLEGQPYEPPLFGTSLVVRESTAMLRHSRVALPSRWS
ncbi:LacI family DNA-binding transcriptional regulator [Calidithermus chliarophilus]|uniref:LacI family DNA-binding transcriptional regulator n=1 Tax=Calidithermus chliarophilus TaxID=52023 RepID=UPI00041EEC30|nr:substrate-binding domain-containing protein [Calidithermus chliarophilus]